RPRTTAAGRILRRGRRCRTPACAGGRQPAPATRRSARRLHLELAVLAEVVVVGDRADEPVLAGPERHRRADDLARVGGPRARVLLLLVLAQRAVELHDRYVVGEAPGVARHDADSPGGDRDAGGEDAVLVEAQVERVAGRRRVRRVGPAAGEREREQRREGG